MTPYMLTALLIGLVEALRRSAVRLDLLAFFHLFFGLAYVVTPVAVRLAPDLLVGVPPLIANNYVGDPRVGWIVLAGYGCLLAGWSAARVLPARPFAIAVGPAEARGLTIVGLAAGGLAVLGFASAFGGIGAALSQGAQYRYADVADGVTIGNAEVLKFFVSSAKLVLYFAFVKVFLVREDAYFYRGALLVAAVILLIDLLIVSSRGAVVGTLIALYAVAAIHRGRLFDWRLLVVAPGALLVVLYGKQFFSALPYALALDLTGWRGEFDAVSLMRFRAGNWFVDGLLRETLHATTSLEMALSHAGWTQPFLYFRDYVWLPISVVPASLLGLPLTEPPSVSAINTFLHGGQLIASLPPGLLGSLWYHAGAAGVCGGLFMYGLVGRLIQRKFLAGGPMTAGQIVCFVFIATSFGGFATNGDIKVYTFSSIPFVVLIGWLVARQSARFLGRLLSGAAGAEGRAA